MVSTYGAQSPRSFAAGAALSPPPLLGNPHGLGPSRNPSCGPTGTQRPVRDPQDCPPATQEAMRPLNSGAIQVATHGMRVMTLEDLSAAFFTLNERLERRELHADSMFEAVDHTAVLITKSCSRILAQEMKQGEAAQNLGATILKLTGETREAVEGLHARDIARDATPGRAQRDGRAARERPWAPWAEG